MQDLEAIREGGGHPRARIVRGFVAAVRIRVRMLA